ncbi:hypothetical protein WJX72_007001 [[Myrmecia] bisecta]|uniref:Uncharacterized protein n=1 Tax=[Myrmecia] bisecta TaxID=41462 RepID=A0AAW1QFI2_9CHLO
MLSKIFQENASSSCPCPVVRDGFTSSLSQVKQFEAFFYGIHDSSGKATEEKLSSGSGRCGQAQWRRAHAVSSGAAGE